MSTNVRIVNVDSYMCHPVPGLDVTYSDFRASSVSQVPIVRIFGSTDTGDKICLHIHGVFPYLYIPHDGTQDPDILKYQIAANIDKAINVSFGQASSNSQHVYKISLVSGIPLYGYHVREHQFFKIYLYNPSLIRKVSNMLQNEVILGKLYQPHESHIPYIMQFMIDYNLHGMSKIELSALQYRVNSNSDQQLSPHSNLVKQSVCKLEADAFAHHILNHLGISEGNLGINPGIAALWEDEKQRRRDHDEKSDIGPCLTLDQLQVEPTKSHVAYKMALIDRLALSENLTESVDYNISVYPAETPPNQSIINASLLDFNSSLSGSLNESIDLNVTLGEDGRDLYEILQDLVGDVGREEEEQEDDCVLSQVAKVEEDDDDLDLSISLAETTPMKKIFIKNEEDELNTTLVPQIDGQFNNSSDESEQSLPKTVKKRKSKYISLPICVSSPKVDIVTDKQKTLEDVKRKLNFTSTISPSISEETIECNLQPIKIKDKLINVTEIKLTTSELYDLETNFKAKEGTSKNLTQNSDNSDIIKLSSESDMFPYENKSLDYLESTSTSASLTPYQHEFNELQTEIGINGYVITPLRQPPCRDKVLEDLEHLNLPHVRHQPPFYSNYEDVTGSVEVGYNVLRILSKSVADLDECPTLFSGIETIRKVYTNAKCSHASAKTLKLSFCSMTNCLITPIIKPPTVYEVQKWKPSIEETASSPIVKEKPKLRLVESPGNDEENELEISLSISPSQRENSGQITGVTLDNTYGFKITPENFQEVKAVHEWQFLTILSIELHIKTRSDLLPDPEYDSIRAIFYAVSEDSPQAEIKSGYITVDQIANNDNCQIVQSENELLEVFVELLHQLDPDILVGYEIEMLSWGYLIERGRVLDINLATAISRITDSKIIRDDDKKVKICGRIVLDIWRLLRHEIALQSYTFENIMYHILHKRIPLFSYKDLSIWWENPLFCHRTISHYCFRVGANLQILEQLDLIGRTSELARLFGIQFFEVLSRGSQFRVESMMLRLAKPLNYIPVSPSIQQRAHMKAPEYLPLILEPESKFYVDPVIVLDFQSLYPSMIIAYNYCYSTCLGKIINLGKNTPFEFGATHLKISPSRVKKLLQADCLNFSPCGVAFVTKQIRDGIMPRMLRDILDTRLMVKKSMKNNKNDPVLQKVLHNRQLGLKLIANVTYGYTAANFSGRMPAVELGDSVVSKGRETLQRAIKMVETTPEWGAKVVYGDTDSLFVLIPGKSRKVAFEIGEKIAKAVTNDNPDPVKLKLEKVYQPCILQTKKRYVGYMYESPDQKEAIYDAKGIETVRRDGCPAVAKMLEKSLRMLFETKDVSLVKSYVLRQFSKILQGRVSLQDLTFAKEYRGSGGYRPGACVPALELTRKWTAVDRRKEPRSGERVPYIIVNGPPGVPLIRLVRSPRDFLLDSTLRPNGIYYITKVIIPPINRCFKLIGADLNGWFNQMPRKRFQYFTKSSPEKKSTISQYFWSTSCASCGEQTQNSLCEYCKNDMQKTAVILHEKIRCWEKAYFDTKLICHSCSGFPDCVPCISLDCPVFYRINQTERDFQQTEYVRQVINNMCDF